MNKKLLGEIAQKFEAQENYLNNDYDLWESWYKGKVEKFHTYNLNLDGKITKCEMKSFGMPKTLCESFSNLTIGNVVNIDFVEDDVESQLYKVLDNNNFNIAYQKFIEKVFLYGMGVTIQYVEDDKVKIDFVDADSFVPLSFENGTITKIATISQNKQNDKYINVITIHENLEDYYYVSKRTFVSKYKEELGNEIVSEFEETTFEGMAKFQVYNLPIQSNINIHSNLGISIFANLIDNFKSIDEIYDSLSNEIVLGRKRIFVGKDITKTDYDMENDGLPTKYFDTKNGVFQIFDREEGDAPIIESNMQLRIEELNKALNLQMQIISIKSLLEPSFFSIDKKGQAKTATEIKYMEGQTQQTKAKYQSLFIEQLEYMIKSILELLGEDIEKEFEITFGYGTIENEADKQATLLQEFSLGIISKEEYLREAKGWSAEKIERNESELNGVEEIEEVI